MAGESEGSVIIDIELDYSKAKKDLQDFGNEAGAAGKAIEQGIDKSVENTKVTLSKLSDAQKQLNQLYKSGKIDQGQYDSLSKRITETSNAIKENGKQLQASERDYSKSQSQVEQLTARLAQLDAELTSIQQKTVEEYGLDEYFQWDDAGLDQFLAGMMENNAEFQKLQKEAALTEEKISEFSEKMESAGKTSDGFRLSSDKAAQAASEVGNAVKDAGDSANTGSGGLTTMKLAFANLVAEGIKLAISALKEFISHGIELAASMETVGDRIESAFGEKGAARIDEWAQDSINSFGLAEVHALNYAASLGELAQSVDLNSVKSKDLAMNTTELVGRIADLRGAKADDVYRAMESALTGSGRALRQYGIVMSEQTLKEYALSKGISRTVSEMTESEKIWLRYQYLMEKGTALTGDAQVGSEKYNSQLNRMRQIMDQLATQFAQKFLPALTTALSETNDYLQEHGETLTNLGTIVGYIINVFLLLIKAITALPPEIIIMVGILLTALKTFTSVSSGLGGLAKTFGAASSPVNAFIIKILALAAVLSVLLFLILAIKDGTDKATQGLSQMSQATSDATRQAQSQVNNVQRSQGRASGIRHAPPGWTRVGEHGEEWVYFGGGETVLNASQVASLKLSPQSVGAAIVSGISGAPMTTNRTFTDNSRLTITTNDDNVMREIKDWWRMNKIRGRAFGGN